MRPSILIFAMWNIITASAQTSGSDNGLTATSMNQASITSAPTTSYITPTYTYTSTVYIWLNISAGANEPLSVGPYQSEDDVCVSTGLAIACQGSGNCGGLYAATTGDIADVYYYYQGSTSFFSGYVGRIGTLPNYVTQQNCTLTAPSSSSTSYFTCDGTYITYSQQSASSTYVASTTVSPFTWPTAGMTYSGIEIHEPLTTENVSGCSTSSAETRSAKMVNALSLGVVASGILFVLLL